MASSPGRQGPSGLLPSWSNRESERAGQHALRLARRRAPSGASDDRATAPFPSPWHRIRSAVELAAIVVLLGVLAAALVGALLATAVVVASHVLDG